MKKHHEQGLNKIRLEEGDLIFLYPKKLDAERENLTIGYSWPYEVITIYEDGLV